MCFRGLVTNSKDNKNVGKKYNKTLHGILWKGKGIFVPNLWKVVVRWVSFPKQQATGQEDASTDIALAFFQTSPEAGAGWSANVFLSRIHFNMLLVLLRSLGL